MEPVSIAKPQPQSEGTVAVTHESSPYVTQYPWTVLGQHLLEQQQLNHDGKPIQT